MLRLRPFDLRTPASLDEAVRLLAEATAGAQVIAGGTDLLPNMKLLQSDPPLLVSLRDVPALSGVDHIAADADNAERLTVGATTRLVDVAESPEIRRFLPAFAHAAGRIAGPQIRNMATLGGNLCLDTRCRYINQSELFRDALGGCLKSHGVECHVVPGGQGCVAALSTDSAPVLIAYGASLDLIGPQGARSLPVAELYNTDGLAHLNLKPGEIIVRVVVPVPASTTAVTYRKWSVRKSIDFPLVSVAVRLDLAADGTLADGCIVVGVLGPRPRNLGLSKFAGRALNTELAADLGDLAFKRCKPLPNVPYDADYRRERLRVEVKRAVREFA